MLMFGELWWMSNLDFKTSQASLDSDSCGGTIKIRGLDRPGILLG